jgi:hypothetical protein
MGESLLTVDFTLCIGIHRSSPPSWIRSNGSTQLNSPLLRSRSARSFGSSSPLLDGSAACSRLKKRTYYWVLTAVLCWIHFMTALFSSPLHRVDYLPVTGIEWAEVSALMMHQHIRTDWRLCSLWPRASACSPSYMYICIHATYLLITSSKYS